MIILRDYQIDIINKIRSEFKSGKRAVVAVLSTGGGKTAIAAEIITKTVRENNYDCWFIVHKKELVDQTVSAIQKMNMTCGIVLSGYKPDYSQKIQVCSIQTLVNRFHKMRTPKLIIFDECHMAEANTWQKIINMYKSEAYFIGLTATPWRLDGKGLGRSFDSMVIGPSTKSLIDMGALSKYKAFSHSLVNTQEIRMKMGDYDMDQFDELIQNNKLFFSDVVSEYKKHLNNKRAILFAPTIESSKIFCETFKSAGIGAEHLDGELNKSDRENILKRFSSGETKILCNCNIVSTGFDVPAVEGVLLARPTMSLSLVLQQMGRALRPLEGKEFAIILDHVENIKAHGLPDEERDWSLSDRPRSKKSTNEVTARVKICNTCFAANLASAYLCVNCSSQINQDQKEKEDFTIIDTELKEIDKAELKKAKQLERKQAKTYEDLLALGKSRGYKNAAFWAKKVHESRGRK